MDFNEILKEPAFWVAVSLGIFLLILLFLKVPGMAAKALDARADKIRGELDQALKLRAEAQALLAEQQQRLQQAQQEAAAIVAEANAEARRAAAEAKEELAATIARRRKQAEEKIARAEEQATQEIRAYAAQVSVGAAKRYIGGQMNDSRSAQLVDSAIADLPRQLRGR